MHHALEFSHMLRHLFSGILRHGGMESLLAAFHLVAGDILVVNEVGGDGDIEYGFIGILHADHTVATGLRSLAAFDLSRHSAHESHLSLQTFVLGSHSFEGSFLAIGTDDDIIVRGSKVGIEGDAMRLVGRESYHHYIIGKGGDNLALIGDTMGCPAGEAAGRIQTQFAIILRIAIHPGSRDIDITKGLVRHSEVGIRHDFLGTHILCLTVFALPDEVLHDWKSCLGMRIGILVRLSCPDGFLVQLQTFGGWNAIYHSTQTAITQRQGIGPDQRWFVVPELIRLCCCLHRETSQAAKCDGS